MEMLVVARYRPNSRRRKLEDVNLRLERMRLLLRLARESNLGSNRGFESSMKAIDEVGRMVHGWRSGIPSFDHAESEG